MKVFKVPVVMMRETYGHIEVFAESMDKAKDILLTQDDLARLFNSHHVDSVSFIIENKD